MRTNFSLTFHSVSALMGAGEEFTAMDNDTVNLRNGVKCYFARDLKLTVIFSFICVVGIFGLVGNGTVIWLLGFRIKRNPFTTYILHLAVADFGILIAIPIMYIVECNLTGMSCIIFSFIIGPSVIQIMYSAGQFLLTAISIDRCMCVLFPLWYRYHRPKRLSAILCAVFWLVSFLVNGICVSLNASMEFIYHSPVFYVFLLNAMVCLPLITISTLVLVIKICFKPQLRQQGKLLKATLLSLFFFLTLAFPMNVILLIHTADWNIILNPYHLILYGLLCITLNSFINPLIYFLVGRQKRRPCRENVKLILQRVFMEEEVCGVELQLSVNTLH